MKIQQYYSVQNQGVAKNSWFDMFTYLTKENALKEAEEYSKFYKTRVVEIVEIQNIIGEFGD